MATRIGYRETLESFSVLCIATPDNHIMALVHHKLVKDSEFHLADQHSPQLIWVLFENEEQIRQLYRDDHWNYVVTFIQETQTNPVTGITKLQSWELIYERPLKSI